MWFTRSAADCRFVGSFVISCVAEAIVKGLTVGRLDGCLETSCVGEVLDVCPLAFCFLMTLVMGPVATS